MNQSPPLIYAPQASESFAQSIASHLDLELSPLTERNFEDGEHKARPEQNVRGRDVYIVQSLHGDATQSPNDKLIRLLWLCGSMRDAGAGRVTAVVPYLCYARKDRRTKPRDPIATRYIARLFEAVGIDALVTMDVHNLAAFENSFGGKGIDLQAGPSFAAYLASLELGEKVAVVSPDAGGVKRADHFRAALVEKLGCEPRRAFLEKRRSGGRVSGEAVIGDVEGAACIIIDDLVASGTTLVRAAEACRRQGAARIYAAATHGLFVEDANEKFAEAAFESVLIANTIPPFRLSQSIREKYLAVVDVTERFAEAIHRLHTGGDIEDMIVYT